MTCKQGFFESSTGMRSIGVSRRYSRFPLTCPPRVLYNHASRWRECLIRQAAVRTETALGVAYRNRRQQQSLSGGRLRVDLCHPTSPGSSNERHSGRHGSTRREAASSQWNEPGDVPIKSFGESPSTGGPKKRCLHVAG